MKKPQKSGLLIFSVFLLILVIMIARSCLPGFFASNQISSPTPTPPASLEFDGQQAYQHIVHQLSLGPRYPGSDGHRAIRAWIVQQLTTNGWQVEQQTLQIQGHTVHNLIAHHGQPPEVILGAHYDTRLWADRDPDPSMRGQPVPGANDGASGVAVLLELARVMPLPTQETTWLVFFDAEDQGNIPGWDWILGSTAFVQELQSIPQAVVIVDMIGDKDLNIYLEKNSDADLSAEIWAQAAALNYQEYFINEPRYSILDDHTPFLMAGIPAIDIIDFDYPAWHTTTDDIDQVSAQSLQIVGNTLLAWLENRSRQE